MFVAKAFEWQKRSCECCLCNNIDKYNEEFCVNFNYLIKFKEKLKNKKKTFQ